MSANKKSSISEQRGKRRARAVGLVYINEPRQGITRRRCGSGFTYNSSRGKRIAAERTRKRIEALAIPPAWEDVRICSKSNGHIQAVGRDAKGRTQYIYHERWHAASAATKFDRMHLMAQLLPRIRRRVRKDLSTKELSKNRVVAAVVRLLDKAHLRVGNPQYAEVHGSRGATTLIEKHVDLHDATISLDFPGKSGQRRKIEFADKKVAKVISDCEDIDGQFLFSYATEGGHEQSVDSTAVNEYLREIADESITAKDFRTWSGSVIALSALTENKAAELTKTQRKKALGAAISETAQALGNTNAVCRDSYIHPALLAAFETGELDALVTRAKKARKKKGAAELNRDERLFTAILPALSS